MTSWTKVKSSLETSGTVISLVSSIVSAVLLLQPKISTTPQQNIKAGYSIFLVKNEGYTSVYDLKFSCKRDNQPSFVQSDLTIAKMAPGKSLWFICEKEVDTGQIKTSTYFKWLVPYFSSREEQEYSLREGTLIPDDRQNL